MAASPTLGKLLLGTTSLSKPFYAKFEVMFHQSFKLQNKNWKVLLQDGE